MKTLFRFLTSLNIKIKDVSIFISKNDYSLIKIIKTVDYLKFISLPAGSWDKYIFSFLTLWKLFSIFRTFVSVFYAILPGGRSFFSIFIRRFEF